MIRPRQLAATLRAACHLAAALFVLRASADAGAYDEPYRPQFHFSPAKGWIGDPDGCIRHDGKYHLYWWGHAISEDLVHWREQPPPMKGGDGSFSYFSGSVAVDLANTSGFGDAENPAMVALYTAHQKADGFDDQRLSISRDGGQTFHYYEGNPVLAVPGMPCRDPDVFWHEPTRRWILLVVAPERRKVLFYSSTDLKSWKYLSEFGPLGARAQVWEVPLLLQIPVEGQPPGEKKWVLVCGMGPNKIQYFPGDFDGTRFTPDDATLRYLRQGEGLPGQVFADFESEKSFEGWQTEGDAFSAGPSAPGNAISGQLGRMLLRSAAGSTTGAARSPDFVIDRNCIDFLIGGAADEAGMNLVVDGRVVRTARGDGGSALKWKGWDVSGLRGATAHLELFDNSREPGGRLLVDHILFSDALMDYDREQALWVDWGADFYAARAFRSYDPKPEAALTWIAWMGNWDYANQTPTSWGRGAESIPRTLTLAPSAGGWQLRQRPLPALAGLRGKPLEIGARKLSGTQPLAAFRPSRNTYEIDAVFAVPDTNRNFGLNLCVGGDDKVVLGYDARTSTVSLDRRRSGDVAFHPKFPTVMTAPVAPVNGRMRFQVFVDQSSIEVFVNDGAATMTALIFPKPGSRGVELFSTGAGATLLGLRAWELRSIWP